MALYKCTLSYYYLLSPGQQLNLQPIMILNACRKQSQHSSEQACLENHLQKVSKISKFDNLGGFMCICWEYPVKLFCCSVKCIYIYDVRILFDMLHYTDSILQVLLPLPFRLLRLPLSLQRTIQRPRSGFILALYSGQFIRCSLPATKHLVHNNAALNVKPALSYLSTIITTFIYVSNCLCYFLMMWTFTVTYLIYLPILYIILY